jgi:hypothetical protein
MAPKLGASTSARSCSGDFTRTSRALRASAAAIPRTSPASRPMASVTGRLAEDGRVGTNAGLNDPDRHGGPPAERRRALQLGDEIGEHTADGVGDVGRTLWRPVGDRDVEEDGVQLARGPHLGRQLVGRLRQAEPPDHIAGHPGTDEQLRVGRHAVLGELRTLESGLRGVRALGRHVHRQRCRVLGRAEEEDRSSAAHTDKHGDADHQPPFADNAEIFSNRHKADQPVLCW